MRTVEIESARLLGYRLGQPSRDVKVGENPILIGAKISTKIGGKIGDKMGTSK